MQVTRLANAVTLDGKWTTSSEWSDTNRVPMYLVQGPQSTGYIRLKHDSTFVYLLVDFVSDTTTATNQGTGGSAYDRVNMGIDQNVNDTNTNCCDLTVVLAWNNGKNTPEPVSPPSVQGTISYDATNDPDTAESHAMYELAIPIDTFQKPSAVRISVWDWSRSVNMHWPPLTPPGSWSMLDFGDLVFSDVVVPELPLSAALILAVVVLAVTALTRRRRYEIR